MTSKSTTQYFAGMDGLRALAVVAVLVYHFMPSWLPGGYIGVDIFFVISGFLITTLLVNEHRTKNKISLMNFWSRRARRLLPALLTTVGLISAAALFAGGDVLVGIGRQILGALSFSSNWLEVASGADYFTNSSPRLFTNLWSLGVEEQFYLLWPFVVLILLKIFKKKTSLMPMWLCVLLAGGSAYLMYMFFQEGSPSRVYYGTDTHIFGLMLGAATAFWLSSRNSRRPVKVWSARKMKLARRSGILALAAIIWAAFNLTYNNEFTFRGGLLAVSVATVILLLGTISSRGLLQSIFELPLMKWIGLRSYGIYLWHWPAHVLMRFVLPGNFPDIAVAGISTVITLLAAGLSFKFIEMPVRDKGIIYTLKSSAGIKTVVSRGKVIRRQLLPHPSLLIAIVVCIMTVLAVVKAPSKTVAEERVERGRQAIIAANKSKPTTRVVTPENNPIPAAPGVVSGEYVTIIGDSVTLSAAEELQAKFPGVYIDAAVSRSLYNGFEVIDRLAQSRQLRPIVVIALGTNNNFGDGNLVRLIAKLSERKVVFVTSHTEREWSAKNNTELRTVAVKYPHVRVADWDQAIAPHPHLLAADKTHPNGAGAQIYADVIARAVLSIY